MQVFQSLSRTPTAELPALARHVEALGFAGISISDHLVRPGRLTSRYPYSSDGKMEAGPATPYPDCWVTIAALAQAATRLRFLSSVYVLPMRDPFTAAKAISTAAVLSGERLMFGVGVGWMAEEFALTGQRFDARGRRSDEMLEVIAKLFSGDMVEHHGEFYDFGPVMFEPKPVSKPWPAIHVGGESGAALRRAARHGDGWIGMGHTLESVAEPVTRLQALRDEHGTAENRFEVTVGGPVTSRDDLARWRDAGVNRLVVSPWRRSREAVEGLKGFAELVYG